MNEISSRLESRASILALDWGQKKIGGAVLPAEVNVPVPLGILENNAELIPKLQEWLDQYQVKKIVVGLPLSMSGEAGAQAEKIKTESEVLKQFNLPIEYIDERLSSQSGGVAASLAGLEQDDAYAAVALLDKFL